jgi:aminopeptidase-like protein
MMHGRQGIGERAAMLDFEALGQWMYELAGAWYPICRSITGEGLRQTLRSIGEHIPLEIHEVPTGTPVLDWFIPKEWNIRGAHIKNEKGVKIVDFAEHNLHVMGYSVPVKKTVTLQELLEHCYSIPEHPNRIPYRTSYYEERWGFCLPHRLLEALRPGKYEVCIDSTLREGSLSYGECVLPGASKEEVLISAHVCHPSLANDNLSGMAVALVLADVLHAAHRRYTYRFVFAPGTIGAIAWLHQHRETAAQIKHGLILACVGDSAELRYKRSRRGDAPVDRAAAQVLARRGLSDRVAPFTPYGYDERQYCSPGFNLAVGCLMRSGPGGYPEYHSSADNMGVLRPASLAGTLEALLEMLQILEEDARYRNLLPYGEPQLGRRGLYGALGGTGKKDTELAMLWVLNYSDGAHSLLDIAERSGLRFEVVRKAADLLLAHGLLAPAVASVSAGEPVERVPGAEDPRFWDDFFSGKVDVDGMDFMGRR